MTTVAKMVGSIFLATLLDWQVRTVILQSIWRADTERTHNLYVHYSHKAQLNFWGFIFLLKIYILKLITLRGLLDLPYLPLLDRFVGFRFGQFRFRWGRGFDLEQEACKVRQRWWWERR